MWADLLDISREAGRRILEHYENPHAVAKADQSPLTDADMASHRYIIERLRLLTPEVPVISEESDASTFDQILGCKRYWLVDPLDGTKEFLKRTGEFTVNIALMEDHRPVMGIVHAPVLNLSFWGGRGRGALRQEGASEPVPIHCRVGDPFHPMLVASRDHAGPAVAELIARFPGCTTCSMGSSLKFCLVAEGKADVYLRDLPTCEWDTAAAQCVLEGAGGGVFDLEGAILAYGKPGLRNPGFIALGDASFRWRG